jgi:hypothetical protein
MRAGLLGLVVIGLSACAAAANNLAAASGNDAAPDEGAASSNRTTTTPLPPPAQPQPRGVVHPQDYVTRIYGHYAAAPNVASGPQTFAYSDRLRALQDAYDNAHAGARRGPIDFDWWVNAREWAITDLYVSQRVDAPDRLTVSARWRNRGRADGNRFLFVRRGERWFLDDVVNGAGSSRSDWTLSALLQQR